MAILHLVISKFKLRVRQILLNQILLLIAVAHLLLILIALFYPIILVLLKPTFDKIKIGKQFEDSLEGGLYDDINETKLGFSQIGRIPVIEHTHRELIDLLQVTLSKEFNE